jgi:hypothetical protein
MMMLVDRAQPPHVVLSLGVAGIIILSHRRKARASLCRCSPRFNWVRIRVRLFCRSGPAIVFAGHPSYYSRFLDQFSGSNAIVIPATLLHSLYLLAVVLEQQTGTASVEIMTDTGACTEVVFGLLWVAGLPLLSARTADISAEPVIGRRYDHSCLGLLSLMKNKRRRTLIQLNRGNTAQTGPCRLPRQARRTAPAVSRGAGDHLGASDPVVPGTQAPGEDPGRYAGAPPGPVPGCGSRWFLFLNAACSDGRMSHTRPR